MSYISSRYPHVHIDEHILMPDHIHMIVVVSHVSEGLGSTASVTEAISPEASEKSSQMTLSSVIGAFKSLSDRAVRQAGVADGSPLWQRGYYERIIRSESELLQIREYIAGNPVRWRMKRGVG
jgi:REP element-mobilizing transposase RayT